MDFNAELTNIVTEVENVLSVVKTDLVAVLHVAEEELPKLQHLLSVGAGLTALIPGINGYLIAAEDAVDFVETLVKTLDGVLMPSAEAATISVSATSATDAEKRSFAVKMLADQFPTVPTTTHDIHIGLAYANKTKVQTAA